MFFDSLGCRDTPGICCLALRQVPSPPKPFSVYTVQGRDPVMIADLFQSLSQLQIVYLVYFV